MDDQNNPNPTVPTGDDTTVQDDGNTGGGMGTGMPPAGDDTGTGMPAGDDNTGVTTPEVPTEGGDNNPPQGGMV